MFLFVYLFVFIYYLLLLLFTLFYSYYFITGKIILKMKIENIEINRYIHINLSQYTFFFFFLIFTFKLNKLNKLFIGKKDKKKSISKYLIITIIKI